MIAPFTAVVFSMALYGLSGHARHNPASFPIAIVIIITVSLPRGLECVALGAGVGAGNPGIGEEYEQTHSIFTAQVNITYKKRDMPHSEIDENCQFSSWSRIDSEQGRLVAVAPNFCSQSSTGPSSVVPMPYEKWILLLDGSACRDLLYRALSTWSTYQPASGPSQALNSMRNASAILVFGGDFGDMIPTANVPKQRDDPVVVLTSRPRGEHLFHLHGNLSRVDVRISVGASRTRFFGQAINKTSMLFLSISFVVLMVISLAWLVFYYVQRSRYTHAKQRLSKRLMRAAKKAMGRMPLKTIYSREDVETECDVCAICIEGYKTSDVVRILPCHHVFHKPCIDPWLVEQRSCPICKIDILKAFGMQVMKGHHHHGHSQLDADAPSSSLVDLPPLSSSLAGNESTVSNSAQREFDSDGVEIVRFHQVAQVEHHRPSASWSSSGGEEAASSAGAGCTASLATPRHDRRRAGQSADPVSTSKSSDRRCSGDSDSSGSGTVDDVFDYESRCRRQQQRRRQQRQFDDDDDDAERSLSCKNSSGSSASASLAGRGGEAPRRPSRRGSGPADRTSPERPDGRPERARDVFPSAAASSSSSSPRPPFVPPGSAGDRARASASELEPLSGRRADDDSEKKQDEGSNRGQREYRAGILLTKFPMETGL